MNQIPPARRKNKSLSLVKPLPSSSLDKFKRLQRVEVEVDEEISKLGDLSKLQNDECQLIHLVCNLVENVSSVKLTGAEKKDFVITKITALLSHLNSECDLKWISKVIDCLVLVGAISKVAKSSEAVQSVKSICSFFAKN